MAAPAQAATTCRQAARDLALTVGHTTSADEGRAAFSDAENARPDCHSEFATLAAWYADGGKATFPFPASGDPAKGFLGPIGWWWNILHVSLFGRNALLMFLFGWELFLTPIFFAFAVVATLLGGVGSLFRRGPRAA